MYVVLPMCFFDAILELFDVFDVLSFSSFCRMSFTIHDVDVHLVNLDVLTDSDDLHLPDIHPIVDTRLC